MITVSMNPIGGGVRHFQKGIVADNYLINMPQQDRSKYRIKKDDYYALFKDTNTVQLTGFKNPDHMVAIIGPLDRERPNNNNSGRHQVRQEVGSLSADTLTYYPAYFSTTWTVDDTYFYSPVVMEYGFWYMIIEFY